MYEGDKPCIVDFYATWCGPCKMIAPILEELAGEYEDKIDIYKIDTEKEEELAAAFGIRSIPSLLFCPMGEQPQMARGAMSKVDFKKAIDEVLRKISKQRNNLTERLLKVQADKTKLPAFRSFYVYNLSVQYILHINDRPRLVIAPGLRG